MIIHIEPHESETRAFVHDRQDRVCPRCMGLSTRENAALDCGLCGNTGTIEVDTMTEVAPCDPHPR